jgi:hypothetical protein
MNKDFKFKFRFRILPEVGALAPYFVYSDQREFSFFRNSVKIDGYGLFRIDDRLQQFTGFYDSESKEIFDGDILSGQSLDTIFDSLICERDALSGGFRLICSLGKNQKWRYWFHEVIKLKIIGNVTEHKLFEGK